MKFSKIENFHRGWVVGDFQPSLFSSSDVTVGILNCAAEHKADGHYHKKHTEYNILISGKAQIDNTTLFPGDIFIYEPYDRSTVEYLEDSVVVVIKNPSVNGDKYE